LLLAAFGCIGIYWVCLKVEPSLVSIACPAGNVFEALTFIVMNSLRLAYVQIRLRDAVRHPWPLNENIPVFDTLSHIYTGLLSLFDLPAFGKHRFLSWDRVKLAED